MTTYTPDICVIGLEHVLSIYNCSREKEKYLFSVNDEASLKSSKYHSLESIHKY